MRSKRPPYLIPPVEHNSVLLTAQADFEEVADDTE
jgi:hypothetical protein